MANSILDALNESILSFKQTRARNRSSKPSPSHTLKESSSNRHNSSLSESENFHHKNVSSSRPQPLTREMLSSNNSSKVCITESIGKIPTPSNYESSFRTPMKFKSEEDKTAGFAVGDFENPGQTAELQELFNEISELKSDQKNLEAQIAGLEEKICEGLKTMHEPLKQADFSSIISRIGGLQDKFANRPKSNYSTEKLSDLFEKISKLESEAERIKRENNEVEELYHQSLNEIYEKIDKLKGENKKLTDIILSSSVNSSPKHADKRAVLKKSVTESTEKIPIHAEISLKQIMQQDQKVDVLEEAYREKEFLLAEVKRIEKELNDIPVGSKSMANKKKKQNLEQELLAIRVKLEEIEEKIQEFDSL